MREIKMNICLETATRWYNGTEEVLKQLAIVAYPELAKKELPKNWEELENLRGYYVATNSCIESSDSITLLNNRNVFATREQAEASIALAQLSQLREVYRNGWKPNWKDYELKYCIVFFKNEIKTNSYLAFDSFLSFQDAKTRDLFLENFEDLIEKTKPLLS